MKRIAAVLGLGSAFLVSGEAGRAQEGPEVSDPGEQVYAWGLNLPSFPSVPREIAAFPGGDESLTVDGAREYARRIRLALFEAARDAVAEIGRRECRPFVRVSFPDPEEWGISDLGSTDGEFLQSLVRTEAVACYSFPAQPGPALDLYTSADFRMEAESRIERMWPENGLSCVATKGVRFLLSPTEVCNRVDRLVEVGLASEHSQVTRNGSGDGLQKVFFKESLKTFVSTPGGLAFHYINYTRSVNLGRASRWVAPGKIQESQEAQMEELRERLRATSGGGSGRVSMELSPVHLVRLGPYR